jgi:nicotinamidase-related amidase
MMSEALKLNPKKTALVLIDLQNGVVTSETKPYSASEVIERSRKLADAFRAKNAPVVYVRVLMSDYLSVPADQATNLPKDLPADFSEIAESAGRQSGDLLVTKRHWGAFAATELDRELRHCGVETVVLTGIATNMGVESTLRQGTGFGFRVCNGGGRLQHLLEGNAGLRILDHLSASLQRRHDTAGPGSHG